MFNKTFHLRTMGVPAPWRPLITIAAAGEETFYRPARRVRPGGKKKPGAGQQLELFPAVPQIASRIACHSGTGFGAAFTRPVP